jgi:poly(A) polymerase
MNFQSPNAALAVGIVATLRNDGFDALLVGGCVRDILLGREPEDFDVATGAPPARVMELFPRTVPVGEKFGVVMVIGEDTQVEVATFRSESGYADRRHPQTVEFSDAVQDAARRDFTVNGMFLDPMTGEILDHVGGKADLEARMIRAIGNPDSRFGEDALRILRAMRFASSLGFRIETGTWDALCHHRELIREISAERIRMELTSGLTRPHPDRFLGLLDESGILEILLPEVAALKGCEQPPEFHPEGDVFVHTKLMLSLLKADPSPALAFAVLLHDIGKPATACKADRIRFNNHDKVGSEMADVICRRLAFSNCLREQVVAMVQRHMGFMSIPEMRESTVRRFLAAPTIGDEIELHRVDCLASHRNVDNLAIATRKLEEMRVEDSQPRLPPPLINGDDLIALGLEPGPSFRVILNSVQDAQLEGQIATREEALRLVKSGLGKH